MKQGVCFVWIVADAGTDMDLLDMLWSCTVDEYSPGHFLKEMTQHVTKRSKVFFHFFFSLKTTERNAFVLRHLISFVDSFKTFQSTGILFRKECHSLLGMLLIPAVGLLSSFLLWTWELFRACVILVCRSETVPAPSFSPSSAPLSSQASTQGLWFF